MEQTSSKELDRARTGHVYTRLLALSLTLVVLDICELIYMLPELLHPCDWPWENVYGSYDHLLVVLLSSEAAIQFANGLLVSLWFVQFKHSDTNLKEINIWSFLGLKRYQVPFLVYFFQVLCVLLNMWILAYHQTVVLVLTTFKLVGGMLILMQSIFSPTGLCCFQTHQPSDACFRKKARNGEEFLSQVRSIGLFSLGVCFFFLLMYGMQYGETFATSSKFFSTEQLRTLNNDQHFFNRDLQFHQISETASKLLELEELPPRRVVLIVVDGLRDDYIEKNQAFRQLVETETFARMHGRAALPTMSVPNWVTILSGVPPELTGYHGNLFSGETPFDTFFVRSRRLDTMKSEFMNGMTGCPWWSTMQASQFPRLKGDGTLSAYSMYDMGRKQLPLPIDFAWADGEMVPSFVFREHSSTMDGAHTDDTTDRHRVHVAKQALADEREPFRFFLLHFSNPDTQAHYAGTSPAFNVGNSYNQAITATAGYIQDVFETLKKHSWSSETFVIISSDHGEVDAGGHGGTSEDLQNIPILFKSFRASSENVPLSNVPEKIENIAPTISALLGLPVPRQSQGRFLSAAVPELSTNPNVTRDLYEAYREWLNVFMLEARFTAYDWCEARVSTPALDRNLSNLENPLESFEQLRTFYEEIRLELLTNIQARNIVLSFLWMFFILYVTAVYYIKRSYWGLSLCGSPSDSEEQARIGRCNRWMCLLAFLLTVLYIGIVMGAVLGSYHALGYSRWDSTMVHSLQASLQFVWVALLPGILYMFLINRMYHAMFLEYWENSSFLGGCANCMRLFCLETTCVNGYTKNAWLIYLTLLRMWMMYFALLVWAILFVLQGMYSFLLPFFYSNWILTETTWTVRFQVSSTQLMMVPLLIGNLLSICLYSQHSLKGLVLPIPELLSSSSQATRPPQHSIDYSAPHISDEIWGKPHDDYVERVVGTDMMSWMTGV